MSGAVLDISPAIGSDSVVWPGDTPFELDVAWSPESGDAVTVSRITMSPHTGAHADAPLHVGAGPADAAGLDLAAYWGPCIVLDWRAEIARSPLGAIEAAALLARAGEFVDAERVLFRTLERALDHFPENFPHFTPEAAAWLAQRAGLRLVGIDTFSVDPPASKDLAAHRALFGGGLAVLEGLELAHVAPGAYELCALPLRIRGGDASPVRAALRRPVPAEAGA
ncbi:MAG: cyclase family protein [Candidatus Eisenbacteria bacterium]